MWLHEKYVYDFKKIMQTLLLIYIHVPILEWGEHVDLRYVLTIKESELHIFV